MSRRRATHPLNIPVLVVEEEHGLEGYPGPLVDSLEVIRLVRPAWEYLLP